MSLGPARQGCMGPATQLALVVYDPGALRALWTSTFQDTHPCKLSPVPRASCSRPPHSLCRRSRRHPPARRPSIPPAWATRPCSRRSRFPLPTRTGPAQARPARNTGRTAPTTTSRQRSTPRRPRSLASSDSATPTTRPTPSASSGCRWSRTPSRTSRSTRSSSRRSRASAPAASRAATSSSTSTRSPRARARPRRPRSKRASKAR